MLDFGWSTLDKIAAYLKCTVFGEYTLSFEDEGKMGPPDDRFWDHIDQKTDGLQVVKLTIRIHIHGSEHRLVNWLQNHPELRSIKMTELIAEDLTLKIGLFQQLCQMPHLERVTLRGAGPISKPAILELAKIPSLTHLNLDVPLQPSLEIKEANKLLQLVPNIQHVGIFLPSTKSTTWEPHVQSLLVRWWSPSAKMQFEAATLTSLHISYLKPKTIPWIEIPTQLTRLTLVNWTAADWPTFFKQTLVALPELTELRLPACRVPGDRMAKYMATNHTLTTLNVSSMVWDGDFDELSWLLTNTTLTTFQFSGFTHYHKKDRSTLPSHTSNAWLQTLLQTNTTLTHLALPYWTNLVDLGQWSTTLLRFDGDCTLLYANRVRNTSLATFCLPKTRKLWENERAIDTEVDDFSKQELIRHDFTTFTFQK